MKRMIILVGFAGSGKSFFANILRDEYDFKIIELGDYVREEAAKNNMIPLEFAKHVFSQEDIYYFVRKAVSDCQISTFNYCIVGPRKCEEVEYLLSKLKCPTSIVALESNFDVRNMRRSKQKDKKEKVDLKLRDAIEISWGLKDVIDLSDIKIENKDGQLKEYFREYIKKIMGEDNIETDRISCNSKDDG